MMFSELKGKPCSFYGIDNNRFRLDYGDARFTFEAVEDESDGYRSMMGNQLRPKGRSFR